TQRMPPRSADERTVQRDHVRPAITPSLRAEFLHLLAHFDGRRLRRHWFAETNGDGVGESARQFPEEAARLETEDTAPHAVEADGNDRRVHPFHDALEAAPKRQELA